MKRRDFIKNMGLFATTISPVARIGGALGLGSVTTALSAQEFGDYKAIVIFDMDGGNDAMNMFSPTTPATHATYKGIRTNLGVELYEKNDDGEYTDELSDLYGDDNYAVNETTQYFTGELGANQPYLVEEGEHGSEDGKEAMYIKGSYHTKKPDGTDTGLGIHALMPEIASLYNKGVLSIASNTGVLIEPVTKEEIEDESVRLPGFLFSHGNQRELIATLQAGQAGGKSGWAGRLADEWLLKDSLGLNISYGGVTKTFMGLATSGLTMSTRGPTSYQSYSTMGENFEKVLENFDTNATDTNIFDRFTNKINAKTAGLSIDLNNAWEDAPIFASEVKDSDNNVKDETYPDVNNSYGDPLFTVYSGNESTRENLGIRTHHGLDKRIFEQLEATAKTIKVSQTGDLAANRQIFYVRQAGHDVHGNQADSHSRLMRGVSLAVSDFYKALEAMGLEKDVLLVSLSEFGRTIKSNSDGTDHGWGGHSFMMCGDESFNGGNVFGDVLTDLSLEGDNAYTNRARIIPTTSIEQMLAPALKWFGVDDA
ncbi:MAG: hypothetical protein DRH37_09475, partial [Deltaproteobacteria bacterium]